MDFIKKIVETEDRLAPLFMRLALGIMIFPHGAQKLIGWFGGFGFSGTMGFLTGQMGLPWILAFGLIITEFFGGIGILLGLFTRAWAGLVGLIMLCATLMVHLQFGFFMNWMSNQKGEGIEFFILAIGLAIALVIEGGGKFSVDSKVKLG